MYTMPEKTGYYLGGFIKLINPNFNSLMCTKSTYLHIFNFSILASNDVRGFNPKILNIDMHLVFKGLEKYLHKVQVFYPNRFGIEMD